MSDLQDLGPCCACGRCAPEVRIRTILALNFKAPLAGRGWGCVACNLAANGAIAVLCDDCAPSGPGERGLDLRWACRGLPGTDGRVSIEELTIPHKHNLRYHPELSRWN